MTTKVQAQLAAIRKEAHRIELHRMRQHVHTKRGQLKHLESEERAWTKARKSERLGRLRAMRINLRGIRRSDIEIRRERLRALHDKRQQFATWWTEVRRERARRLTEIARLRQELKDWRALGPARHKQSVAQITEAATRQLAAFDAETRKGLDALQIAVRRARDELHSDEYDLKQWSSNRRQERQPATGRQKKPRGEARSELASNVELNLQTPEELAYWHHGKATILRNAKELGLTEGDQIAEWIRERVEEEPEQMTEYLQKDADAWLAAELRKQGFAA